jgi:hypothetical protein
LSGLSGSVLDSRSEPEGIFPQAWGRKRLHISEKEKNMNQDNRVLGRMGARELTEEEAGFVTGGIRTATVCTAFGGTKDGDPGEC